MPPPICVLCFILFHMLCLPSSLPHCSTSHTYQELKRRNLAKMLKARNSVRAFICVTGGCRGLFFYIAFSPTLHNPSFSFQHSLENPHRAHPSVLQGLISFLNTTLFPIVTATTLTQHRAAEGPWEEGDPSKQGALHSQGCISPLPKTAFFL